MSVPLPSPSEIAPATPKYRSRPQPITDVTPSRRPHSPSSPRASAALVSEENWRDRNNSLGQRSNGRPGPERTIGGFEKREVRTALGDGNGSVISNGNAFSPGSARTKDKMGDGEVKRRSCSHAEDHG